MVTDIAADNGTISILLVDDHRIMREGLRRLLSEAPDMMVVGEAADGRTAIDLTSRLKPAIVLMDINMPVLNGIEATRAIRSISCDSRVIALTMYRNKDLISRLRDAGAMGYLPKDCAFDELLNAVRIVSQGHYYPSQKVQAEREALTSLCCGERVASSRLLTPKERRVVQLLAEGRSGRDIADLMGISVKTVETHRSNIKKKLKIRSIAKLTKFAIREGITSPDA